MSESIPLIVRAVEFAASRHAGQTRKGRSARPYLTHLAEVALLLAENCEDPDPVLIAAAYLHDIVEDGRATLGEVAARFGEEAAALVEALTDDMSLPDEDRKRRQVEEIAGKPVRARLLKLADKVSNVREIADDPPEGWSAEEQREYVQWGIEVVDAGCRGLNGTLEAAFDAAAAVVIRRTESG